MPNHTPLHESCPQCKKNYQPTHTAVHCTHCRLPLFPPGHRYKVVKQMASGGFGLIYLAIDVVASTLCVMKTIKTEFLSDQDTLIRFQREITLTEKLSRSSPHFVTYQSQGQEAAFGRYYVMELLRGQTLAQRLEADLPLRFHDIFHIFKQLCTAMTCAHKLGVLHRDLKPNNIFLTTQDEDPLFVKLFDMGLAKPIVQPIVKESTQEPVGTPQYMSPEQCLNETLDERTDVYAMGIILYELLTRELPFDSNQPLLDLLRAQLYQIPQPIRQRRPDLNLPQSLDVVVSKALAKHPKDRYQSCEALWKALEAFQTLPGGVDRHIQSPYVSHHRTHQQTTQHASHHPTIKHSKP